MAEYTRYVRTQISSAETLELRKVDSIASSLIDFMREQERAFAQGHVHGAGSSVIQALVGMHLMGQPGFVSESIVLTGPSISVKPRADFYGSLGPDRGIVVEVERGGTTTNNHDLKDLWKTHLAENAQHLFLVVPQVNFRGDGSERERPYAAVVRRLAAFFGDDRREVDVLSLHILGY